MMAAQAKKDGQETQGSYIVAFTAPARRPKGHARDWKPTEARRQCSFGGGHCSLKLQVCHSPKFTNYSQIFITTQKSPKTKVVQNQKFYNFVSITIS